MSRTISLGLLQGSMVPILIMLEDLSRRSCLVLLAGWICLGAVVVISMSAVFLAKG
jgi:hypothetical protein